MIVKRGDAKIVNVINDDEHKLDDEGTRKAMERAAEEVIKSDDQKQKEKVN